MADLLPTVWFTGAPGAGKSTLGWLMYTKLAAQHDLVAYVDVDQLQMVYPPLPDDPDRDLVLLDSLDGVLTNALSLGVQAMVVTGVFEPRYVDQVPQLFPQADLELVVLHADEDAQRERNRLRGRGPEQIDDGIQLDRRWRAASWPTQLDSTQHSPEQLLDQVRWPTPRRVTSGELPSPGSDLAVEWLIGPRGVGKSTLSWGWWWTAPDQTGYLDFGQLSFLAGRRATADTRFEFALANLGSAAAAFGRAGMQRLVVNGDLSSQAQLDQADAALRAPHTFISLTADEPTLAARLAARAAGRALHLPGDDLLGADAPAITALAHCEATRRLPQHDGLVLDTSGDLADVPRRLHHLLAAARAGGQGSIEPNR